MSFNHAVLRPRKPNPEAGVINEQIIVASIKHDRKLQDKEARERAQKAGASGNAMSTKEETLALLHAAPVWEDIQFDSVRVLDLSYRSIARIANLAGMPNLVDLRLDNNSISTIENLDHLSKLERLDLSFNRITVMRGLEQLPNLTDLALANNNISRVEGMQAQKKLVFLSLTNNDIRTWAQCTPLVQLPRLQALSLAGNDVVDSELDYAHFVLARLPRLRWLDYKRVSEVERAQAAEAHAQLADDATAGGLPGAGEGGDGGGAAAESKASEGAAGAADGGTVSEARRGGLHIVRNLWWRLIGEQVEDGEEEEEEDEAMVAGGGGRDRVLRVPGVRLLFSRYQEEVREEVARAVQEGQVLLQRAEDEQAAVDAALAQARGRSDEESRAAVLEYRRKFKRMRRLLDAQANGDQEGAARQAAAAAAAAAGGAEPMSLADALHLVGDMSTQNDGLRRDLIQRELRLHDACNAMLNDFDTGYNELLVRRSNLMEQLTTSVELLEKRFATDCKQLVFDLISHASSHNGTIVVRRSNLSRDNTRLEKLQELGLAEEAAGGGGGGGGTAGGAAGGGGGGGGGGASDDSKQTIHIDDLQEELGALLRDKDLADSAMGSAGDQRLERLLGALDAFKVWARGDRERNVNGRLTHETKRNRERIEEVAAVWKRNRMDLDALHAEE